MFSLGDISKQIVIECVVERFEMTGCKITPKDAERITTLADGSIYYTQRLAHSTWNNAVAADRVVNEEKIDQAFKAIVNPNPAIIHVGG